MSDPRQTDPVEAVLSDLFDDDSATTPRAAFAEQLRARLEAELGEPADAGTPNSSINFGSLFYATIPAVDLERSARFYSTLFGWELHRGAAGYHINNVYPPMGLQGGGSTEPEVWFEVDDIHRAVARVRALGGTASEPANYDSGWSASCVDPQGVKFHLQVPVLEYRQQARRSTDRGELFYWTLPAPEASVATTFYRELLGWEFDDPGSGGGMHVENRMPDGGIGGGREGTHPDLFFRVDDLEAAMATVVELGGTAEFVGEGDEGRHAMCVDDQGIEFGISQPNDGY
jgi:predicted enzyme related to lactoylglutathione lyase